MPFDLVGLDDRVADALGKRCSVAGLFHLRHDDSEFITAHARHDVELAGAPAQALTDQLQQFIADMMSERVVDALELIEVEAQYGEALATFDALDLVIELLKQ